ncbi:hypothetical protein [Spirochaeta isovalerica]|uniref:Uncharacterized protein n=1 Tax=Spirochaeta isovalerica TaxID=150 RepID=A0A841R9D6_9SPIO|nr:hypothetical protein [Spirochaeta isovalerica]MBB6480513.1 hypothetical protein [Spirochaeta isovalerica]
MRQRLEKIINDINEHFSSAWILLSDTTIWLSNHPKLFPHYETSLREWRRLLETNRGDMQVISEVRKELAELRKALRLQGYNLKLGSLDLKLEGFRNDDCLSRGFSRCVIYIMVDGDVLYTTGTANHLDLDETIDARLNAMGYRPVLMKHYLWYKWVNRVLILSGSATETVEDFEELKQYVAENKAHLLKKLSKL